MDPPGIYLSVHRNILPPSPSKLIDPVSSSTTRVVPSLSLLHRCLVPYDRWWFSTFTVTYLRGDLRGPGRDDYGTKIGVLCIRVEGRRC